MNGFPYMVIKVFPTMISKSCHYPTTLTWTAKNCFSKWVVSKVAQLEPERYRTAAENLPLLVYSLFSVIVMKAGRLFLFFK